MPETGGDLYFSTKHRRRLARFRRARRIEESLDVLLAVIAITLAVTAYSETPRLSLVMGGLYIVLVLVRFFTVGQRREAIDVHEGEVLWGLFAMLNQAVFNGDNRTRFTLFRQDPFRPSHIIPWFRYRVAGKDAIDEAEQSNAHYKRGEGFTGKAWDKPGVLSFVPFPRFTTRSTFEQFYIDRLQIDRATVSSIGPYMEKVTGLFSYGFQDSRGKFLGVLSIDLQMPIKLGDPPIALVTEENETKAIAAPHLMVILQAIENVLVSFEARRARTPR